MREAFARGDDIHDVTARGIFGIADGSFADANQRRIAKSVNFGLLYGMSDFGLAQRLSIDRTEARAMTDAYFARFPMVRAWIESNLEYGRENGYVQTILGRRRYMPDLRSRNFPMRAAAEREATNAPMQGSAADLMKLAMVNIDRALAEAKLDASLLLQIHDEPIFEAGDGDCGGRRDARKDADGARADVIGSARRDAQARNDVVRRRDLRSGSRARFLAVLRQRCAASVTAERPRSRGVIGR